MNGSNEVPIRVIANLTGAFAQYWQVFKVRTLSITCIHLVNTSGGAVTVRVCVVPNGATADATNALLWDFSIPANDMIEIGDGLILKGNDAIFALCSAAGAINLFVSGKES